MNRTQLLEQIEQLKNQRSIWGQRLAAMVIEFENDHLSLEDLTEMIADYRRLLANEMAVAVTEDRSRAEACLEGLLKLAQAVA